MKKKKKIRKKNRKNIEKKNGHINHTKQQNLLIEQAPRLRLMIYENISTVSLLLIAVEPNVTL